MIFWKYLALVLPAAALTITVPAAAQQGGLNAQQIDHMIRKQWKTEEITPAPPIDDAGYLRRAYIDITGCIPPAQAVEDFIADRSPNKRAAAVEALLDSPGYADEWTDYWDNILMSGARGQAVDRTAFRQWLHAQFTRNTGWNEFVYDLITATGQNSAGGTIAMTSGARPAEVDTSQNSAINGATNWILKYQGKPEDLSGNASKIFLGVQIQCAQCHDHKTEKWKQTDFRSFTANFINTRPRPVDGGRVKGNTREVDLEDINRPFQPRGKQAASIADYVSARPAALDGTDFSDSTNRRKSLGSWMVADENPWFADAIVNRMWGHFLGRAFVEPIDDFRPSNPPVMPDLLKALSADFKQHNYDLKRLIRQICATQVYQLSASSAAKTGQGNLYWARFRLKPMAPNELLDSLVEATNVKPVLEQTVGQSLDQIKFQLGRQFQFLFDVDEEFEQKDFEGTIPQALMLLNGGLVNSSVRPIPGTALADVREMQATDTQKIQSLYLRTLSRMPTASETQRWNAFLIEPRQTVDDAGALQQQRRAIQQGAKGARKQGANTGYNPLARATNQANRIAVTPKDQAYEDMFWALLNSSEFMFNH